MLFEWDDCKNTLNVKKHGVPFEQAKTVFNDPLQLVANLFFSNEGEEIIRIILARKANTEEQVSYEKY